MKKPRNRKPSKNQRLVPVNPFKLFYLREKLGKSVDELSSETRIPISTLHKLENGKSHPARPRAVSEFATLNRGSLDRLESVLGCSGQLRGGQENDFATLDLQYYEENRQGAKGKGKRGAFQHRLFRPAAIVFDFDGTLTTGSTRTTWERLWTALGYTVNDCGVYAAQFFRKEISHDEWCRLTLEKFNDRKLTRDMVITLGKEVQLIDGFSETIREIHSRGIPMYIVSGSIGDVVLSALGHYSNLFKRIEANIFQYAPDGHLANIVGTRFDFEGKADFVKMVAKELNVSASDVLFIGNSINDEHVKSRAGATTMLVNPHYTGPSLAWDLFIPDMQTLLQILPHIGIDELTTSSAGVPTAYRTPEQAVALLSQLTTFDIAKFTVVGGYRRFDDGARAKLLDLYQQIRESLREKPTSRQNYLVCAAPGSGKSYFVQEVAKELKHSVHYTEVDLSRDDEAGVRAKLSNVGSHGKSSLVLIDEIDGRATEQWPYDAIYKLLDVSDVVENPSAEHSAVFILVGSTGSTPAELRQAILPRFKGSDLIDRIPKGDKYYVHIPPMGLGDGLCVYVSKVLEAAALRGIALTHIHKMAAYFVAMTALHSPRQIKMLADHAVSRMQKGTSVLHYDHHFEPGAAENKRFWDMHKTAASALAGNIQVG